MVFKFADRPGVWFFCQIQMCMKKSGMCDGLTVCFNSNHNFENLTVYLVLFAIILLSEQNYYFQPPTCASHGAGHEIAYITDIERQKAMQRTKFPTKVTQKPSKTTSKKVPYKKPEQVYGSEVTEAIPDEYFEQANIKIETYVSELILLQYFILCLSISY